MSKEQLIQELTDTYEQAIALALQAREVHPDAEAGVWGAREIIAHLAGWETITGVRLPAIANGMSSVACPDRTQQTLMDDAINAAFVGMIGEQSLAVLCELLRRAYRNTLSVLQTLDERFFQPDTPVYAYVRESIDHCMEHRTHWLPVQL